MVTGDSPKGIDITEFPTALQPVISKALKRSKDDRYQSALEMREAILQAHLQIDESTNEQDSAEADS